jgi:hypothetical protein
VTVRKDCPIYRRLLSAVREVLAHEGLDAGSATVLDYMEIPFAVRVEHLRATQLVFLDDALKRQEAVRWVLEGSGRPSFTDRAVGVHAQGQVGHRNL